jgi:(p)ppGpp synthase/HD superfamily hydrolase
MKAHPTLGQTLDLIRLLHDGVKDAGGLPYWHHPVAVMLLLPASAEEAVRHAALLHDVLEDTDADDNFLRGQGYSDRVIALVEGVTRTPEKGTYRQWIDSIARSKDRGLILIKLADMQHNSSPERMSRITNDEKRRKVQEMVEQRYLPGIRLLTQALLEAD